jgi:hypothetical protein
LYLVLLQRSAITRGNGQDQRRSVDSDAVSVREIINQVDAVAAAGEDEAVVAGVARQGVVAGTAREGFVGRIADQPVVARTTGVGVVAGG